MQVQELWQVDRHGETSEATVLLELREVRRVTGGVLD